MQYARCPGEGKRGKTVDTSADEDHDQMETNAVVQTHQSFVSLCGIFRVEALYDILCLETLIY